MKNSLKTKGVLLKFSPEQYKSIAQRAERCGVRGGPWMRAVHLQVAKRTGEPGIAKVREPDGATI